MKKTLLILMTSVCFSLLPANSQPPLHKAIILHDLKTVKKLIDEGSDVNEHSRYCNPLMIAVGHKDPEMVELLLKNGAKLDTCISTSLFGHNNSSFEGVYELSKRGQILYTPFYYAIKLNQFGIVKLFCQNGYDISKKMGGTQFTYPIIAAAKFERTDMLNYLLEKGVDLTVKDNNGRNALMSTVPSGNLEITYLLLQKGCPVNDSSNIGYTPLMYAVKAKGITKEMVNLLITRGADINHFSQQNESALSLACLCNNRALALFLLDRGATGKDTNTEIESNARMNHFLGDFYFAKSELQIAKDYYVKAEHYYYRSIQKEEQDISKVNKEKAIDKTIDIVAGALTIIAGQALSSAKADQFGKDVGINLTNSQKSILTNLYTDEYYMKLSTVFSLSDYASLNDQKTFHQEKINQFELAIYLIDAINSCIDKGLIGNELNSCIKNSQLSHK